MQKRPEAGNTGSGRGRQTEGRRIRTGIKALAVLILICAALPPTLTACGTRSGSESGPENDSGNGSNDESGSESENKSGKMSGSSSEKASEQSAEETRSGEKTSSRVMVGPQTPPEGERYDEWKEFDYSDETTFRVKSFFTMVMTDEKSPKEHGFIYSPEIDGTLEITDASMEPVGGEMKLRSGGYVDITVKTQWEGAIEVQYSGTASVFLDKMAFTNVSAEPCDAYTGTSFLNSVSYEENEEANDIDVGEAVADSLIESDVTWKSHTWRIYAGDDLKNSSFNEPKIDSEGNLTTETAPVSTIETFTFRVPADYDGLVLCIPKDITPLMSERLNERGDFIAADDRYADALTDFTGQQHDASDYYFVRVSDLLKKFESDGDESLSDAE